MKRVLVTGSRNWGNVKVIYDALYAECDGQWGDAVIVHGHCPTGADYIANDFARRFRVRVERHPADWDAHGKAAGPRRNQEMVDLGADVCLAFFHADSRGTKHCAEAAERAGIPVRRWSE